MRSTPIGTHRHMYNTYMCQNQRKSSEIICQCESERAERHEWTKGKFKYIFSLARREKFGKYLCEKSMKRFSWVLLGGYKVQNNSHFLRTLTFIQNLHTVKPVDGIRIEGVGSIYEIGGITFFLDGFGRHIKLISEAIYFDNFKDLNR